MRVLLNGDASMRNCILVGSGLVLLLTVALIGGHVLGILIMVLGAIATRAVYRASKASRREEVSG